VEIVLQLKSTCDRSASIGRHAPTADTKRAHPTNEWPKR